MAANDEGLTFRELTAKELTVTQVADMLGCAYSTVIRLDDEAIPEGQRLVPWRRVGRRGDRRYQPADVERVKRAWDAWSGQGEP